MKTKTNILKKAITFSVVLLLFVSSSSFTDNKKEINIQKFDYYFFLEYTPGSTSDYSKTRYISGFIYYAGYDECGYDYDFIPKAKRAFENHIKANYDESYVSHTMTHSQKMYSTDKIKTNQQAREVLDKYLADKKKEGKTVIQTSFSYSCE
ncbi:MAG: hypothetical protein WC389_08615 [Lutibacter sp.]|jgi:hypothetical protein